MEDHSRQGKGATDFQAGKKRCPRCQETKPLDTGHFGKLKGRGGGGWAPYCKPCTAARSRESYARRTEAQWERVRELDRIHRKTPAGRERERRNTLRRYGLTPEEYDLLLSAQGGGCAICGRPETTRSNNGKSDEIAMLTVDHDHKTGRVRGLLCASHNKGLGCFDDSVETLTAAIRYLEASG